MAVTRDDVAKRAGVSTAVVSYVLNDGPRPVSVAARERVLAAIAELGYRRDGAARTLAGGRSHSLGLIVPDVGLPYFGRIAQEITGIASELGFQMLIGTSRWNLKSEHEQLQALAERRVEGIVLMSVDPEQDRAPLDGIGVPVAIVDRPSYARDGAAGLTEHLIGHGHRSIGFLAASGRFTASRRRLLGWRDALRRAELEVGPLIDSPATESGGVAAAEHLLDCDAVVCETDLQALGLLRRLHDLGVRVPQDLAVASSDSTTLGEFTVPSITGLQQPSGDIASEAVRSLLDDRSPGVRVLAHEGFEIVPRESCGCPGRV